MQLRTTISILAVCAALLGLRYQDAFRERLFPDPEIHLTVRDLPVESRSNLIASQIAACLRNYPGMTATSAMSPAAEDFCGCKVENLSRILNPREFSSGRFDNVQRYIDNAWNVQTIVTRCRHRPEAGISL